MEEQAKTDRFFVSVAIGGCAIGLLHVFNLWQLDAQGLSSFTGKLPYWDFSNLWAGGRLAAEGKVASLFDPDAYRHDLSVMFDAPVMGQEWSYPPSMLLIGSPLSLLPIGWSYLLWTFASLTALFAALRLLKLPLWVNLALVVCPGAWINFVFGQNGAFTSALLIAGLSLVQRRPIIAGLCLGALSMKPHLGLLVPVCLIAGRHWKAMVASTATVLTLFLVSGLFFGFSSWVLFIEKTAPMMRAIMEAPFPTSYQANAISFFIFMRSLGVSLLSAYLLQGLMAAFSIGLAFWMWRKPAVLASCLRVPITATLTLLATPYAYSYDMIPICICCAAVFFTVKNPNKGFLATIYLWPLFVHLSNSYGVMIGFIVPLLLTSVLFFRTFGEGQEEGLSKAAGKGPIPLKA